MRLTSAFQCEYESEWIVCWRMQIHQFVNSFTFCRFDLPCMFHAFVLALTGSCACFCVRAERLIAHAQFIDFAHLMACRSLEIPTLAASVCVFRKFNQNDRFMHAM